MTKIHKDIYAFSLFNLTEQGKAYETKEPNCLTSKS
jgi:hypothetical protein